jgi:hypothetical protein
LSSAILYVAIVVIWACVLIPRWLRRDSSSASKVATAAETKDKTVVDPAVGEETTPAPVPAPVPAPAPVLAPAPPPRRRSEAPASRERRPAAVSDEAPVDPVDPVDPGHRRTLSARRRLLLMLVVLAIASGALAGTKMAAWWVIVPPSVMLLGYLLLLRAAAKADAERRELARHRTARAARAAETGRLPVRQPTAAAQASAAPVAHVSPVGPASDGRIITISATPEPGEEKIYDQYADAKLRAVGD